MTTRSVQNRRLFSTKVLTKVEFECPAIVNTSITSNYGSIAISRHFHVFYTTDKSLSTTHTSDQYQMPLMFIANCVQNREITSCLTYKIHLKVIFLLILHGYERR